MNDKAREKAKQKGEELIKRLQAGEDSQALAKELELEWTKSGELKRSDRKIDSTIVKEAFKFSRPEEGNSSFGGTALVNGDYAIIAVNKVTDGDIATIDESNKLNLKRTLAGIRGDTSFTDLLSAMKVEAHIVIQQENVE